MSNSVTSYESVAEKSTVITARFDHAYLANAINPLDIIQAVRYQIASRIADQVMCKLGPAIDKALAEVLKQEGKR